MWLLLAFIVVPMIEIALFIQVGGLIGLGWTLAIVLLTALAGTWLVRSQGALAINNIRRSFNEFSDPSQPLADAAMILIAGVLLLTPGFFTDAVGFLLLTPQVRRSAFVWLRKRVKMQGFAAGGDPRAGVDPRRPQPGPTTIDGEWEELDQAKKPTHHPSEWTRH